MRIKQRGMLELVRVFVAVNFVDAAVCWRWSVA